MLCTAIPATGLHSTIRSIGRFLPLSLSDIFEFLPFTDRTGPASFSRFNAAVSRGTLSDGHGVCATQHLYPVSLDRITVWRCTHIRHLLGHSKALRLLQNTWEFFHIGSWSLQSSDPAQSLFIGRILVCPSTYVAVSPRLDLSFSF